MAFTLYASGAATLSTGVNTITTVTGGPATFVAAFDFTDNVGVTFAVIWNGAVSATSTAANIYRSDDIASDPAGLTGFVAPPLPVFDSAELRLAVVTGTPALDVNWAVYKLT